MFSNVVLVVYCKMSISNAWFSHLWLVKMSILVGEIPKISWKITHTAVSQSPVLIKSLASSPHHSFLWFHLTPHGFLKSPPQTYSIGVGPQNCTWSSTFSPPPSGPTTFHALRRKAGWSWCSVHLEPRGRPSLLRQWPPSDLNGMIEKPKRRCRRWAKEWHLALFFLMKGTFMGFSMIL